jgi:hypothetical protein
MILIITGQQRSGTTMLRYFCHSHPQIAVTHEFGTFLPVGRPYHDYAQAMRHYNQTVCGDWGYVKNFPAAWQTHWYNTLFTLRYLYYLRRVGTESVDFTAIESALKRLFKEATIVGDKLPVYRLTLPQWVAHEQIRCLLIYRDCRDVTSSFLAKKRGDWQGQAWAERWDSATKIAQRWIKDVEQAEQLGSGAFIIRYESLVTQPEQVVPGLANWLGVSPEGFNTRILNPCSIGKYKEGLTTAELAEVMDVAGPTLARLGYV